MADMMSRKYFLDSNTCKKQFYEKEIFVFGTGVDADRVRQELSEVTSILAYIDNNRYGSGRCFFGKEIISVEQCLKRRSKGQPILVAAYKYGTEICDQLTAAGLTGGIDFFVWDDAHIFSCDEITEKYINFMNRVWKHSYIKEREGIILVPFYNRHDSWSVRCAYLSNFLADKLQAEIYAYSCFGTSSSNASEVCKKIYQAFNVETLIDSSLNEAQQNEADQLCESVWNQLSTWEDWNNITIYGIQFGVTMIRHLLRVYIPSFDVRDFQMYSFLKREINTIVFWYHYIFDNDIKVALLMDGVSWEGYIRDIAVTKGIPVYIIFADQMAKATLGYYQGTPYQYFKDMWGQLTRAEQQYGIEWAKEHIEKRLHGGTEEIVCWEKNHFAFAEAKSDRRILEKNDKIKVMICPHIFEEECFYCGEQIFDNNYFAWLCHLGEISDQTPEYDWYLKMHPSSSKRDFVIIDMILKKYPKIKKIPSHVSPMQLREEGVEYALTVYGSIGHEYPAIGIQVINAGLNPHSSFDFTWNPTTKEEYDDLIFHLGDLKKKEDIEGLYQFYSMNYLFYNWNYIPWRKIFFENPLLGMDRIELEAIGKTIGTWKYKEYMKEWTKERHEMILGQLEDIFRKLDEWRPDILYKKKVDVK